MKPFITPLSTALGHLQQATGWLMQNALTKPDNAGAAATEATLVAEGLLVSESAQFDIAGGAVVTVAGGDCDGVAGF